MNKFGLLAGVIVALTLGACKEKGPNIEFGNRVIEDSTYVASSAPAAQPHYILAEEFTGATCTNCPAARDMLHAISVANDHRIIVMGIHPYGIGQAAPVHDGKYDFRTDEGTSIKNAYFGDIQGIPAAGFDRVAVGGVSALLPNKWANAIDDRLAVPAPVNIDMVTSVDEATHKGSAEIKLTFTQAITGNLKLSLVLVEDSIIDAQEFGSKPIQYNYVFMHTFRDYISSVNGDAILTNIPAKEVGRTFIRTYKNFDLKPEWKAKNCKLIAFVHYDEATKRDVIQATEVHLGE